ncbi:MAG: tyrosine-type recombinase/integrase [Bifidobacteriaceae bacterium]|jgi:integrase|nr:tyrosine-type recombinase/integrase [Bifidobacteriaceae bacterium]
MGTDQTGRRPSGSELLADFVSYKRGLGYVYPDSYATVARPLAWAMDGADGAAGPLTREMVEEFGARRDGEKPKTWENRAVVARQFALFLSHRGHDAYVPPAVGRRGADVDRFSPRIIAEDEMAAIIAHMERRPAAVGVPSSKPIYCMLVRLLWCCGLRIGEAVALRVGDVDIERALLSIREAKHGKTRLVPMSGSLAAYARSYVQALGLDDPEGFFLPSNRGGGYHRIAASRHMHKLMGEAGVLDASGNPCRAHDIRHSYAVAALRKMDRDGVDVRAGLPLLATFMGHADIKSTEYYLRLTARGMSDVTAAMARAYLGVFPEVN